MVAKTLGERVLVVLPPQGGRIPVTDTAPANKTVGETGEMVAADKGFELMIAAASAAARSISITTAISAQVYQAPDEKQDAYSDWKKR